MRAKRAGIFFKLNCRERSERKIFGKFCTFPQNSSKLRSDYLFSFQKRTNYLFPAFSRSEYLFPKSASPPPPLRIKWLPPYTCIKEKELTRCWLVGWLVVLRINVDLAIFQPYLDLEAGDNQSLKIQVARPGIEPRSSCSASQELNHSATAAPNSLLATTS